MAMMSGCCSDGDYFGTTDDAGECDIEDNYWSPMCDRTTLAPKLCVAGEGWYCESAWAERRVRRVVIVGSYHRIAVQRGLFSLRVSCLTSIERDVIPIQSTSRRRRISLLLVFSRHFLNTSLCSKEGERARGGAAYRIGTAPMPPRRRSTSGRFAVRAGIGVRFRGALHTS